MFKKVVNNIKSYPAHSFTYFNGNSVKDTRCALVEFSLKSLWSEQMQTCADLCTARSQTSSKADVEFEVGFQERAHVRAINPWSKPLVRLLLTNKRKRGDQTMGRRYVIITAEGNITSRTVPTVK